MAIGRTNAIGKSKLQEKDVTITQNGTSQVTPDSGYDGMSKATIITNVSSTPQSLNTIAGVMSVNFSGFVENDYQLFITKMREVLSTITNADIDFGSIFDSAFY